MSNKRRNTKPRDWLPGQRAYLVPTLPTAPAAAYKLPRVTIVTPPPPLQGDRIEIRLPDGTQLWTNKANVRRELPAPPPPPTHRPKPKPRLALADGEEQPALW